MGRHNRRHFRSECSRHGPVPSGRRPEASRRPTIQSPGAMPRPRCWMSRNPQKSFPQALFTILKSRQPSCKSDGSAAVTAPAAVAQPQPNEMAPALRFGMVGELGARVAGGSVVDVLDLARLEVELDAQVGAGA